MFDKYQNKLYWIIYLITIINCVLILIYNYFLIKNQSFKVEKLRRYIHANVVIGSVLVSLVILVLLYTLLNDIDSYEKIFIVLLIIFLLFIIISPIYINHLVHRGRKVNKSLIISYTITIILIVVLSTYALISLLKK